jgi:monofunctional biosynthetic peptidoglycan transglycosylase
MLSKSRLLDIYLNHVEWGEGVFGAEAAAQAHFGEHAWALNASQAARLAVMLPSPKRFEAKPQSRYLRQRAVVIRRRMQAVELPPRQP